MTTSDSPVGCGEPALDQGRMVSTYYTARLGSAMRLWRLQPWLLSTVVCATRTGNGALVIGVASTAAGSAMSTADDIRGKVFRHAAAATPAVT